MVIGLVLAAFLPSQKDAMRPRLRASSEDESSREPASVAEPAGPAGSGTAGSAGPAGFRGGVRDAEGAPVPGANVTLIDRRGKQAGLTAADQDGHYTLTAPAEGSYVPAGSATGHAPCACPVAYDGGGLTAEADLVLTAHSPAHRGAVLS